MSNSRNTTNNRNSVDEINLKLYFETYVAFSLLAEQVAYSPTPTVYVAPPPLWQSPISVSYPQFDFRDIVIQQQQYYNYIRSQLELAWHLNQFPLPTISTSFQPIFGMPEEKVETP